MRAIMTPNATPPSKQGRCAAALSAILVAAVFAFANIPGKPVLRPNVLLDHKYRLPFECETRLVQRGWPLVFLEHHGHYAPGADGPSAWRTGVISEIHPGFLCVNLVFATLGILGTGWFVRHRIRKYGWRFGMIHLLLAVFCVSMICAFVAHRFHVHCAQLAHLAHTKSNGFRYEEWQPFGPYWLRELTGPQFWAWGDTLISARINHSYDEIAALPGKSGIKVLRIQSPYSGAMPSLEDYDNLIAVDLTMPRVDDSNPGGDSSNPGGDSVIRELAQCPTLQGLNVPAAGVTNRGVQELSRLPNIKKIELSGNRRITDDGLVYLESAKSLQEVVLWNTAVTREAVKRLQKALPHCMIRWTERSW